MIELKNVIRSYQIAGQTEMILKGVDLSIEAGELVAIIGPSGAGKSSIMNILGLLDKPTSGQYLLDKEDVSTFSYNRLADLRNQSIGFIFQTFFLLGRMSALQNVSLPLTYRGLSGAITMRRAQEALEKTKVGELANRKPNDMSGGQQQRVAIARALVGKPTLILADEPTGALDSKTGQDVMDLLIDLNKAEKTTVIVITHDMQIAEQCGRIIRVKDGHIVKE